jgi:hypothetical protein
MRSRTLIAHPAAEHCRTNPDPGDVRHATSFARTVA